MATRARSPAEDASHLNHTAVALLAAGRPDRALTLLRRALVLVPQSDAVLGNLGLALRASGALREAADCFDAALRLAPADPDHHFNFGCLLAAAGRLKEAENHYRQALRLRPDFAKAHNNLGNALRSAGRIGEAIDSLREALRITPGSIGIMNNLGNALRSAGRFQEAETLYLQALSHDPRSAETWCNLCNAQRDQRRLDDALASYARSLKLNPGFAEVHFNRAWIHLLRGRFEEGWKEYEWRLQRRVWTDGCPGRVNLPRWKGEPFPGRRLLVYDEQGFGDTIQFARYLPRVKALGGTVIFETRASLLPLFRTMQAVDRQVIRASHTQPAAGADLYVPLLSLPGLFGTTLATIPQDGPYLQAETAAVRRWQERFAGHAYRIGLVWSGSFVDPCRACPPALFQALAQLGDVRLYGLQKEGLPTEADMNRDRLIHLGPDFADFGDTAGAIAHLDLVISVDTAVAHLAGAMGKPTWLLLPYTADWRWLEDREDSPWYPTMRLFRQRVWGDWQEVMERVTRALARMFPSDGSRCVK